MNKKSIVFTACALFIGIGIGGLIFGRQPVINKNTSETAKGKSKHIASKPEPTAGLQSKGEKADSQTQIPPSLSAQAPSQIAPLPTIDPYAGQPTQAQPDNQYYELNATVSGYPIMVTGTPENPYSTSGTTCYQPGPNGLISNPPVDPPSSYGRAYRTCQNFN
ncbi:MAG: hypothetical protein K8F91_06665 [Candidatus Obscuribacterales bacterium]|nr:hypothetical protein [Candidatus Obscuribacterales bacterium]